MFKTFFKEHKPLALTLLAGLFLIIIIIVVIFTTLGEPDDGIEGDSSKNYDTSLAEDQKALASFKIANYLPVISESPAYKITYDLQKDEQGNYSLNLILSAFSASAREPMVKRFLSENFGDEDPLKYNVTLENYYNPFSTLSLESFKNGELPEGFTKSNRYQFGDSTYTAETFVHTLYDGSTNTYRTIYENGEPKSLPKLFFTYSDLPFLSEDQIRSLNSLE